MMAMKRNCSKLISLCLALCMMLSLAVCASAAEIDTSGGSRHNAGEPDHHERRHWRR